MSQRIQHWLPSSTRILLSYISPHLGQWPWTYCSQSWGRRHRKGGPMRRACASLHAVGWIAINDWKTRCPAPHMDLCTCMYAVVFSRHHIQDQHEGHTLSDDECSLWMEGTGPGQHSPRVPKKHTARLPQDSTARSSLVRSELCGKGIQGRLLLPGPLSAVGCVGPGQQAPLGYRLS